MSKLEGSILALSFAGFEPPQGHLEDRGLKLGMIPPLVPRYMGDWGYRMFRDAQKAVTNALKNEIFEQS